jgi:hypothetical protein
MRTLGGTSFAVVASLFVAGCGGGGGGTGGPALRGTLVLRNGSSADLSGVVVDCPDSGASDVTDAAGRFSLDVPTNGVAFRLAVTDPESTGTGTKGEEGDCSESDDSTGDDADVKGAEVEIEGLEDGESCEIEIEIEDGEVVGIHVSKGEKDGKHDDDSHSGEAVLHAEDGSEAYGEIEVRSGEGCSEIEVEFASLPPETAFLVFLIDDQGQEAILADFATNGDGEGHVERHVCGDFGLPFGASDLSELAGFGVRVEDLEGNVILAGKVPEVGAEDFDEEEDGDDEEKDDDEKDDDGKDGDGKD